MSPLATAAPSARRPVQVLAIDGNIVDEGWNGDRAAQFLRGSSGTSVRVRLARRSAGKVPGVASRPEVPLPVPARLDILPMLSSRVRLLSMAATPVSLLHHSSCIMAP